MAVAEILTSPKIVSTVLRHLSPGPLPDDSKEPPTAKQRRECQSALARLATVSRAVSSAALDELWRHIDDFDHVLFALKPYNAEKHMFIDDLTEADWARYQGYATRVRGLHLGDATKVHATAWVLLARWCPREPLLPRLEHLTGFKIGTLSVCYTTLLSASLKSLDLMVLDSSERSAVRMTIQAAQPALRSVLDLAIDDQAAEGSGKDEAVPFWTLTQLHTLQVVHGTTLTTPALQSLASFPHLRVLRLHIRRSPEIQKETVNANFPHLRELELSGQLEDISAFLVATAPPSLESFTISALRPCETEIYEDPHAQSGSSTVRRLAAIYAVLTLTLRHFRATLRCTCSYSSHSSDSSTLFDPLRALPGLRTVAFIFEGTQFHLADARLVAFEDAWPELEELNISRRKRTPRSRDRSPSPYGYVGIRHGGGRRSVSSRRTPQARTDHPTIKTLAIFARAHPHLTTLSLPSIDLDALPALDSVPLLDHGLRQLRVCTLDSGVALFPYACALDMLFPRLNLADAADAIVADEADRGAQLRLLLLALQTGRVGAYRARNVSGDAPTAPDAGGPSAIRLIPQGKYPPPARTSDPYARSQSQPYDEDEYGYPRGRSPSFDR